MTFYNCNILTYSIIISFAYVSPTFVCIWKFWHPALLRPCLLIYCTTHSEQFSDFSDVSEYEKQQIWGKINNSNGKHEKASYFPDSMSVYLLPYKQIFSQFARTEKITWYPWTVVTKTNQHYGLSNFMIIIIEPNVSNQCVENLLTDPIVVQ